MGTSAEVPILAFIIVVQMTVAGQGAVGFQCCLWCCGFGSVSVRSILGLFAVELGSQRWPRCSPSVVVVVVFVNSAGAVGIGRQGVWSVQQG